MSVRALAAFAALSVMALSAEGAKVIHAGALIDGKGDRVAGPATLIIEGERIAEVVEGHRAPGPDDELVDLSGQTVLPGLMDMHTHLSFEFSRRAYLLEFQQEEADYALAGAAYAKRTLLAGFTTVRDLGDAYNVTVALRDAINRGSLDGPRIFTAATAIGTTGGQRARRRSAGSPLTRARCPRTHRKPGRGCSTGSRRSMPRLFETTADSCARSSSRTTARSCLR